MTLCEIIKNNAEMGYHSIVQSGRDFKIVSPFKDSDGHYRTSFWRGSIKRCAENIGELSGHSKIKWFDMESGGAKYIGIYQPEPYKLFQPGDKVLVREDAENWFAYYGMHFSIKAGRLVGKVVEVGIFSTGKYPVWDERISESFNFPAPALEPYYETTPNVKEMTVAEISEALGYDVKVVK